MKVALLPGLGADGRMYGPVYDDLADEVLRVDWPRYGGERTLGELAERLLEEHPLADVDLLVGSSLGGMVASEIAARTEVPRLALLGSAVHPREVNRLLAALAKLRDRAPLDLLLRMCGVQAFASRVAILEQLADAEPAFVRAMAGAIFEWEGREQVRGERARLHGTWDLVIQAPRQGAELLPRAGHMIAMTHEPEVLAFLRGLLASPAPVREPGLELRDATPEDLDGIRALVAAVGREYGFAPEPEGADEDLYGAAGRYFEPGGMLRVLVDGGAVVGVVGVVPHWGDAWELRKIYLGADRRGRGHGRRLLEEALGFARGEGAARLVLQSASMLREALRLYERAGFRRVEADPRSSTCDVAMELAL